jgi:hypothetical protein
LAAHEDSQLAANSHSPAIRKAWVKFVERRLGDVVSRNLQCLVNKLCEPPNQLLHRRLIAFLAKISGNFPGTVGWQLFKIGDRLPPVTFSLPFGAL